MRRVVEALDNICIHYVHNTAHARSGEEVATRGTKNAASAVTTSPAELERCPRRSWERYGFEIRQPWSRRPRTTLALVRFGPAAARVHSNERGKRSPAPPDPPSPGLPSFSDGRPVRALSERQPKPRSFSRAMTGEQCGTDRCARYEERDYAVSAAGNLLRGLRMNGKRGACRSLHRSHIFRISPSAFL